MAKVEAVRATAARPALVMLSMDESPEIGAIDARTVRAGLDPANGTCVLICAPDGPFVRPSAQRHERTFVTWAIGKKYSLKGPAPPTGFIPMSTPLQSPWKTCHCCLPLVMSERAGLAGTARAIAVAATRASSHTCFR